MSHELISKTEDLTCRKKFSHSRVLSRAPVLRSQLLSVGDSDLTIQGVGSFWLDHNLHQEKDAVIFITVAPVLVVMGMEYLINTDRNKY